MTHPLARPVYSSPKPAEACGTCSKKGKHMQLIARGTIECSHVDCPNRNRVTAQPRRTDPAPAAE
jgi:hypothetical protein